MDKKTRKLSKKEMRKLAGDILGGKLVAKEIPEIKASYFLDELLGGQALIVDSYGNFLLDDPTRTPLEEHVRRWEYGERTGSIDSKLF